MLVMAENRDELSVAIKRARASQRMSQAEFAVYLGELAGSDPPAQETMSRWERGRSSISDDWLDVVARAIDQPLEWVIDRNMQRSDRLDDSARNGEEARLLRAEIAALRTEMRDGFREIAREVAKHLRDKEA